MAPLLQKVVLIVLLMVMACCFCNNNNSVKVVAATWCVTRSDASDKALQTALDYACSGGADCSPIQPSGLCYLPNTLQAHASYAFNSYYQRRGMAPGSCSFAGTATIAKTDPSYGSCVYPSSPSTAGGTISSGGTPGSTTTPSTTPTLTAPPPPGTTTPLYEPGGLTPGTGPQVPNAQNALAPSMFLIVETVLLVSLLLVFSIIFQPM